jgi:hypothetical protein
MKITKGRIHKILLKEHQTRKHAKNIIKSNSHAHTYKNKKHFNLRNRTIKK